MDVLGKNSHLYVLYIVHITHCSYGNLTANSRQRSDWFPRRLFVGIELPTYNPALARPIKIHKKTGKKKEKNH